MVVHTVGIANPRLAIPAGAEAHEEKAGIPVPTDVVLLGLSPHLHLRGKSFRFELVAPGGGSAGRFWTSRGTTSIGS